LFNFEILYFSTDGCINKSLTYLLTYTDMMSYTQESHNHLTPSNITSKLTNYFTSPKIRNSRDEPVMPVHRHPSSAVSLHYCLVLDLGTPFSHSCLLNRSIDRNI